MNRTQMAEQFRKAVQMFAAKLTEDEALEIATVYDEWQIDRSYSVGEFVRYGFNSVGDPQLYKVIQAHVSQAEWAPSLAVSLYVPIGINDAGYPVWSRPTGAHDAYNKGDIVDYNGTLYQSVIDGNVWSPDEYAAGWAVYENA